MKVLRAILALLFIIHLFCLYIEKDETIIMDLSVLEMNFSGKEMEYKENLPKVLFYPFL